MIVSCLNVMGSIPHRIYLHTDLIHPLLNIIIELDFFIIPWET